MWDTLGFIATLGSFFMGAGPVVSEAFGIVTDWTTVQLHTLEFKLLPTLVRTVRGALVAGIICLFALMVLAAVFTIGPAFFVKHMALSIFVILNALIMTYMATYMGAAIPEPLPLVNGVVQRYPDFLDPPTNQNPHPRAGEPRFDEAAYDPKAFHFGWSMFTLFVAFAGLGGAFVFIGTTENSSGFVIAGGLVLYTILGIYYQTLYLLLALAGKGSIAAAFAARLGLMQLLIPLQGITKENVGTYVERIKGLETAEIVSPLKKAFQFLLTLLTVILVFLAIEPYVWMFFGLAVFLFVTGAMGAVNSWFNPLHEEALGKRFIRYVRVSTPAIAVVLLIWEGLQLTSAGPHLAHLKNNTLSVVLGDSCLPASGDWSHSLFLAGIGLAAIWFLLKITEKARDGFPTWAKISVGVVTTIAFLFFPGKELLATYIAASGDSEICSPLSTHEPRKTATGSKTESPEESSATDADNEAGWNTSSPQAAAPQRTIDVTVQTDPPGPQHAVQANSDDGLSPAFRAKYCRGGKC